MEDKNNTNNHADDDILESKSDILRASGLDEDDDINIFEDDDLEDSSFEITLEDSEVEIEEPAKVKPKPERVVPEFDINKRILVNERQAASGRRQRTAASSENTAPEAAKPKNIIPEATGSMGALLNAAKKKRGRTVEQNETKASEKPIVAAKKRMPIVELPKRTIKDVKITSKPAIKRQAMPKEGNDLQQQIIYEIVAKDLARFCGNN